MTTPIKVGVVGGYMAYFETIFTIDFRSDRSNHIDSVIAQLGDGIELLNTGLLIEAKDKSAIKNKLLKYKPDVLLIVPTMATPPAQMVEIIDAIAVPTVIANAHELTQIDHGFDMAMLCRHSINVGTSMVSSLLRRNPNRKAPIVVSGFLDEEIFHVRLKLAIKVASLSTQFHKIKIGRLGSPMDGYDHVGIDEEMAKQCNLNIIDVSLKEWSAEVASVNDNSIDLFLNENLLNVLPIRLAKKWEVIDKDENFKCAARMAVALDNIKQRYQLDCGSLSCRGPFGTGLELGAIGCLATSYQTTIGSPFSATGDLVTAVAMFIGKRLGGATLYCELDALDRERQAFIVANTGEGDFKWCSDFGNAEIIPASTHSGRSNMGVVIKHDLETFPATMVGITIDRTQHRGLSLITIEGNTLETAKTSLKVTNAWFETSSKPAMKAFDSWINAGAVHHGALSKGSLGEACSWLAEQIDIPITQI